jgi:voltage-dependent potassium channel beta subunit
MEMQYRRLGRSGLQVSVLSFGSWVTFANQLDTRLAEECMSAAWDAGCNFFDNAEIYANGQSERIMGEVLASSGWPRHSYVVTSKFFWGIDGQHHGGVNMVNTLNRKYLHHAVERALERMQLEFLDVVYCHRADADTPIEETVWALSDLIDRGKALYWGTSEWTADEIRAAYEIAERHHLHKPIVEQPQYNLLERTRVEREYARLYADHGLGLSIWSPLASGQLTGKYLTGIPEDSRATLKGYDWLRTSLEDERRNAKVRQLGALASELGCSLTHLALAWCVANPNVSTVITGASRVEQVVDNFSALDAVELLTPEVMGRIDGITRR